MKLWGGRFKDNPDSRLERFMNSIEFDYKLAKYDIEGSIAHVLMLTKTGILTAEEGKIIKEGLESILSDVKTGKIEWDLSQEDIHMNIEKILIDRIGEIGKKLHTARSRNDQVALDIRMYLKEEIVNIKLLIKKLLETIIVLCERNPNTIMPGYTHLQRAQPILFSHHLLAYFEMFKRDFERFTDVYKRTNIMPLGSGALAGVPYPIDRMMVKDLLGFESITANSIDAVSDRDFALEFLSAASILAMHLSRFSEELILWSSQEFGFITIDDRYSTGSSIMPQKKNPDIAELVRGKTGRIYGNLISLLTTMKGLPLAYNKDMQEDKEPIFDTVDTIKGSLEAFIPMLDTLKIHEVNMMEATKKGFLNATDLADYLVGRGIPFRDAHRIVGEIVLYCEQNNITLECLNWDILQKMGPFDVDVYKSLDIIQSVNKKQSIGGTSFQRVKEQIENYKTLLKNM